MGSAWFGVGALAAAAGVGLGAFGAHQQGLCQVRIRPRADQQSMVEGQGERDQRTAAQIQIEIVDGLVVDGRGLRVRRGTASRGPAGH